MIQIINLKIYKIYKNKNIMIKNKNICIKKININNKIWEIIKLFLMTNYIKNTINILIEVKIYLYNIRNN